MYFKIHTYKLFSNICFDWQNVKVTLQNSNKTQYFNNTILVSSIDSYSASRIGLYGITRLRYVT